ncbi:MAG: hypothetical protein ACNA7G_03035 [Methylobacter sp.]
MKHGEERGIERGIAVEARLLLKCVLARRFGGIPPILEENIDQASR